MAGNRSFTDYVANKFYNELYSYVEDFIVSNRDSLDVTYAKSERWVKSPFTTNKGRYITAIVRT